MAIKIADLLQLETQVELQPGVSVPVRALTLQEMMKLLVGARETFVALYSQGVSGSSDSLAPFLLAAPDLVVKIVALGLGAEGQEADIAKLAPTVQLIALNEIWKLSVPDPKKAQELLSEVTAQLKKFFPASAAKVVTTLPVSLSTASEPVSNSLSPAVTDTVTS